MNNACPECGAVYAVAEKDIGRRIACKKCNTALIVAEEGLTRLDDTAAPPPPPRKEDTGERGRHRDEDDDRPRRRDDEDRGRRRRERDEDEDNGDDDRPRRPKGPGMSAYIGKLKGMKVGGDVSTWLFAIGLFLTIYGFFGSQIDQADVMSREGKLESARRDFQAEKRRVQDKPDGKAPTADESKRLEEREKEWNKVTEPELQDKVSYAEAGKKTGAWWNVMFRMVGFFLLAFGSIGFLQSESNFRRILGGVTILLILLQVIGGAAGIAVQMGGRGG